MGQFPPRWTHDAAQAIRALGGQSGRLLALLLLLRAVAFPYANFSHDARLYGVQTLNRLEGGSFADDLFFRFGSQDQFSIFSSAVAPLATVLGLPVTFFLLFLLSTLLLFFAMQRLIEALLPDRLVSTLALIFMAVSPLVFGGYGIFCVNEPFLTPRIVTNALVMLALERMLAGHYSTALFLLAPAFLLHPIMALGGLGVLTLWWGLARLPRRVFCVLGSLTAIAGVVVLSCPPLGGTLFGQMDDDWLAHIYIITRYNFPTEWLAGDWINVFASLGIAAWAAVYLRREQPQLARLAGVVAVVAVLGLAATIVASFTGYKLLFQAQPYRALWLAKLLQVPLAFTLAFRLWQEGRESCRILAVALLGFLCLTNLLPEELLLPALAVALLALAFRGLEGTPRLPDWLSRSLAIGLVVGLIGWSLFKLWLLFHFRHELFANVDGLNIWRRLLGLMGPLNWLLLVLALLAWSWRRHAGKLPSPLVMGSLALAAQLATFVVPTMSVYRASWDRHHHDLVFISDFLESERVQKGRLPSIYLCIGRIDMIWLELRATSFYERLQIQGVLFSRTTAIEGRRRAVLAGPYEMESLREGRAMLTDHSRLLLEKLYDTSLDCPAPGLRELEALCREEAVDYVIVRQKFDGLYVATNGNLCVYDARQVRAALKGPRMQIAEGRNTDNLQSAIEFSPRSTRNLNHE